jgi:hypothetical protein
MRITLSRLAIPALLLSIASSALADTQLHADLTTGSETSIINPTTTGGQPRPVSFGTADFVLNDAHTAMTMTVTVHNIDFTGSQTADTNDNLVAAHIHASSTVTGTTTAGVVWGFFGNPFNDNNPNDVVVTPFVGDVGGTITGKWDTPEGNGTTLTDQINNILSGHSYINFHTTQFGSGEIRGNIIVVPEPASLSLLAAALVVCSPAFRRSTAQRRRNSPISQH